MGNIEKETKIAILYGGMSSEREVSLRSGKNCHAALQRLGFKNAGLVDVDKNIAQTLVNGGFEVAYNALHGKYGEDGCIQGLLEVLGIPYTGCGVMASAVCMNKEYTKRLLAACGVPLVKSVFIRQGEDVREKTKDLKYPLITKPVSEGSSFGMTKVNSPDELQAAYEEAAKYNPDVLIEEYLTGVSATVGVLEREGKTFATEILELRPKNEWYDYEAKYTKGMTEFILPAQISSEMTQRVKEIAVKAHTAANCSGVSRVDFLIVDPAPLARGGNRDSGRGIPYVLEINTSPGMTDTSDLPAQAAAMGIDYDNLVLLILNSAGLNK
ncbi:MAG: D-alanine--D-alanine ligase [Heliobacteriaceae bacterium]|jgi:D-alanine-D-alanine ligase|nr:D-alanine--D-alanine ligase [Heliobacteriaceae bacterium]